VATAALTTGSAPARVLIVDDSAVARAVFSRIVTEHPRFELVGAVPDAAAALRLIKEQPIDLVVLDIVMPGTTGLAALPDLLAASDRARVLIVSSSAAEGASATIQALALGAADTLVKPSAGGLAGSFARAFVEKLARLADDDAPTPAPVTRRAALSGEFDLVAIGASTGGIHALGQLLRALPASFRRPILVTQHLPASFTPYFAAQVAVLGGRPCDIAEDRLRVAPGRIVIAPGDAHLTVVRLADGGAAVRLSHDPAGNGCLPSVDPMFSSLAASFGARALAVVLSGMGRDGEAGAGLIRSAGGSVIVQDEATSVVWGMPGAIASRGGADLVLPPDEIGRVIAAAGGPR
jgi:two-component system, chemotaxis family, protein-glutamate methylesterase/glutaminase